MDCISFLGNAPERRHDRQPHSRLGTYLVKRALSTIDYANGGRINRIITTVNNYLAITNGRTKYVPGREPLSPSADIVR
jgi:hypothetical protein